MKKEKLNYLEKLCKDCDSKEENPIVIVRLLLKEKVETKDDLLRYKAEALKGDYYAFFSVIMSMSALLIGIASLYVSIFFDKSDLSNIAALFILCIVTFTVLYYLKKSLRLSYINKWQGYVLVVIDELEKEIENGTFINKEK